MLIQIQFPMMTFEIVEKVFDKQEGEHAFVIFLSSVSFSFVISLFKNCLVLELEQRS